MIDGMSRIKTITFGLDGISITYDNEESNSAMWRIDADVYDNAGHPVAIYHSLCSKCGQQETGFPNDAGIYCRRCGSFMVNGQPGQFNKEKWLKSMRMETAAQDTAECGEPEEDHADAD